MFIRHLRNKHMFKYVTVSINQYHTIQKDVELILKQEELNPGRLANNYTKENFLEEGTLAVSVVYKDNIPMDISTAFTRPFFKNGCRLTTKLLVNQNLRTKGLRVIPDTIFTMMNQQFSFILNNHNFDYAFVSREFNSHLFVKKYCEGAVKFTGYPWRYELKKFATYKEAEPEDYHWVTWTPIKNIDSLPLPCQEEV